MVGIYDFTRNFFSFSVPSETYLASDIFTPAATKINPWISYTSLTLLFIGFIWTISIVSFFELYWFMGGMLALLGFCAGLQLDILEIFGRRDIVPLIAVYISFATTAYLFNSYFKNASLMLRLTVFSSLTAALALIIGIGSNVENPFLYVAAYSLSIPLYVIFFILLITGFYIPKLFLQVTSSGSSSSQSNSLLHFTIGCALYLLSLGLLLLKKLYILELNIIYLHPFLIFIISAIFGIWLFKKQSILFSSQLPFVPAGALLYLAINTMAASGLGFACATDNYGLVESYERFMLFGYLFSGFVFVVYTLANFGNQLLEKKPVFSIIYEYSRLSFYAIPIFTIGITIAFVAYQQKYPLHLLQSGSYTAKGDVYAFEGNHRLAFEYYKNALEFDYPNPRANYSMASLAQALGNNTSSKGYYEAAIVRNPNPESYAGLSNSQMEIGEYFQAIFTLQDGLKKFPNNGYLLNNLGMAYSRTSMTDSIVYYLRLSANNLSDKAIPQSNLLYTLNKRNFSDLADSLSKEFKHQHTSFEINRMATFLMNGKKDSSSIQSNWINSPINELGYAYLWNYSLLNDQYAFTELEKFQTDTNNINYRDGLQYLQAWQLYRQGNSLDAMTMLENLITSSSNPTAYSRTLGYWMLEQDSYEEAERLFKQTLPAFQFDDALNLALAQMRINKENAITTLQGLCIHPDSTKRPIAQAFLQMLTTPYAEVSKLPDGMKIYYCAVHQESLSNQQVIDLLLTMNATAGATLWADRLEYLTNKNLNEATEWYGKVPEQQNEACYFAIAKLAYKSANTELLEKMLKKQLSRPRLVQYFNAFLLEKKGKLKEAATLYLKALKNAPMHDELYLPAMNIINANGKAEEGYSILVDAVRRKPDSFLIQEAYLNQCLFLGYTNYATIVLDGLKPSLAPNQYQRYKSQLDSILVQ